LYRDVGICVQKCEEQEDIKPEFIDEVFFKNVDEPEKIYLAYRDESGFDEEAGSQAL